MAIYGDLVKGSYIDEEFGVIVSAVRTVVLDDVAGTAIGDILANALGDMSIPQPGDPIALEFPNVVVERRQPRYVGHNATTNTAKVQVAIEYRRQETLAEAISHPAKRGGSSLNQVSTAKDRDDLPIEVQYPPTATGDPDATGETIRAEADVLEVRDQFMIEWVEAHAAPQTLCNLYANCLNSADFRWLGDMGHWLCNGTSFVTVNGNDDPPKHRFTFEFEYDEHQWKTTVAYRDADGNIPADVKEGVGVKDIDWHPVLDFTQRFSGPVVPT